MAASPANRNKSQKVQSTTRERYQSIVVGRSDELAQLWELALKGRHVVVAGEPGIGKSVLINLFYEGLASQRDTLVFRVSDARQFKTALVELAEQMHHRQVLFHPTISANILGSLSWEKVASKFRNLTVKVLAETLVKSLTGHNTILIWDQFDKATPTEIAWLHQFLNVATLVVGSSDPSNSKLKPILDRVPAKVKLNPLTEEKSYELMDRCFEIAPFGISNLQWYKQEIWRKSQGNPRGIKDLLADHSLEKYIDSKFIRTIQSEQGAKYFPISWFVLAAALGFSVYRYVGRGIGDRDAYIIGAVGMVTFLFLGFLIRMANRP